jgi:hypothetical protein
MVCKMFLPRIVSTVTVHTVLHTPIVQLGPCGSGISSLASSREPSMQPTLQQQGAVLPLPSAPEGRGAGGVDAMA